MLRPCGMGVVLAVGVALHGRLFKSGHLAGRGTEERRSQTVRCGVRWGAANAHGTGGAVTESNFSSKARLFMRAPKRSHRVVYPGQNRNRGIAGDLLPIWSAGGLPGDAGGCR